MLLKLSKCEVCGFSNPLALEEHHDEDGSVHILCGNCHSILHRKERGVSKNRIGWEKICVCENCGFNNPLALHVHHDKENGVEQVLCVNCHNIHHRGKMESLAV